MLLSSLPNELISFLKDQQTVYEHELIDIIETAKSGLYIASENHITFSNQAKEIFQVKEPLSLDHFYERILVQDKKNLLTMIQKSKRNNTGYEAMYRYKTEDEQILWIKEHGIFHFNRKNQRIAMISNYTNQVEHDKRLHKLAYFDLITHLKNRNYLDQDVQFLQSYHIPFTLILMDINSIKMVNDHLGKSLGDRILVEFAKTVETSLKDHYEFDLYRLSGDTFILLFPYVSMKKEVEQIIHRLHLTFERPLILNDYKFNAEPCMGITMCPKDADDLETLIKYANISLAKAKEDSYLNYLFFDMKQYTEILMEKQIEEHIKHLIDDEVITLNYQPIYDIEQKKIVAFEALLNNTKKFTNDKIFDIASKSELIVNLDQYIIEKVIKDISILDEVIPSHIRFSINLSPKTLVFLNVYQYVKSTLDKYRLKGSRIGIEITEQHFVEDEEEINDLIRKLQAIGVEVFLDDFGMGYSSVRNLAFLNYNHIKIDKRLINAVCDDERCAKLLQNIFNFSTDMQFDIVFEGIETEEHIEFIRSIGGRLIQGYYISKPVGIQQAIDLL